MPVPPHPAAPAMIMVAPNGASRNLADHPRLPMDNAAIAREAARCREAGADAIHLHVRDEAGAHSLDHDRFRDAMARIRAEAGPDFTIQLTTEAVGRYSAAEQMALVDALRPAAASCVLRELAPDDCGLSAATAFFRRCRETGIALQHILFEPEELARAADLARRGVFPDGPLALLVVLGRYTETRESEPSMLLPFLRALAETELAARASWMVCAFGVAETLSLGAALSLGGHARVGFENNLLRSDGAMAADNAERVAEIAALRRALHRPAPMRGGLGFIGG